VQALLADDIPVAARQAVMARDLQATSFHRALVGFIEKFAK
jgi:hypothetical protein